MDLLLLLSTGNIWQNEEIDHLGYISEDDEENLVLTFHAQLQHDFINNKQNKEWQSPSEWMDGSNNTTLTQETVRVCVNAKVNIYLS